MKKTPLFLKILPTVLLLLGLSPGAWSSEYSIGEGWKDDQSLASNGFTDVVSRVQGGKSTTKMNSFEETEDDYFDSVSTAEYGNVSARLIDDPEIDQYINIYSFLEITPDNYAELQGHATSFIKKGMFNRFDKGVLIKWKGSIGFDIKVFSPLLRSLQSIKKFKVSIDWDTSETNFTKLIAKGAQGFENLEEMDLSGCSLSNEEMRAIIESTASYSLVRLNVVGNRITADILQSIRKKFKKLEQLEADVTESEAIEKTQTVHTTLVERPIQKEPIPEIARGYEAIYERFLRGVLVYRPTPGSNVGKIELPIASLLNPLEGTFDLSGCGDVGQYLSVSTGYRRAVKPENSNKWEVFITPKFFVERNVGTTAMHYRDILGSWTSPLAVIQDGGWWNDMGNYWYHVTLSEGDLNSKNLYEICCSSASSAHTLNFTHAHLAKHTRERTRFYLQF